MTWHVENDPDQFAYYPLPVFHELYTELDLLLLTAANDTERWPAIVAGTAQVLDRLDHVADPKVVCPTATDVIKKLETVKGNFELYGRSSIDLGRKDTSRVSVTCKIGAQQACNTLIA
jgi:hypothetical protein